MNTKRKLMLTLSFALVFVLVGLLFARVGADADADMVSEPPLPPVATISAAYITPTQEDDESIQPETEEDDVPLYKEEELELLAIAIYCEAGSNRICDECRYRVGDVILTRVADDRFPDTIRAVLEAPKQYGMFSVTGVVWPEKAQYDVERDAVDRAYEVARQLLTDERHSDVYGQGYIWQAEFEQGSDGFWCDGTFFGKG